MDDKPRDPHLRDIDPFEGIESSEETLDGSTIERRATHGVGLLVGQMFGLQILTLGVTVVLARVLSVADYGIFAVAIAVQQAGLALVELGVPAALIKRDEPPTEHEQRAVTGFVLLAASGICVAVGLVAFALLPLLDVSGRTVQLAFVACLALPFLSLRTIPTIMLERRLRYGRITALYSADTIVFNLAALGGALVGWGAFSLVAAVPVGAFAGLVAAAAMQKSARGVSWDLGVIRPLIAFGSQVSARQGVVLARDLTFVGLIAGIGGQTAAGYYAMSQRVLGVPLAFSMALSRVGFPAMARSDDDSLRIHNAARSIAIAAVAIGLPLAICAGASDPLLDVLFGSRWTPSAEIVIPSAAGLFLMASAGSIVSSLFFSLGNARLPLLASIADSLVLCLSAIVLISWNPTFGTGIAILLAAVTGVAILMFRSARSVRLTVYPILRGLAISAAAAAAGLVCPVDDGVVGLVACSASAALAWLALTALFSRKELTLITGLVRKSLKRGSPEDPAPEPA